MEKQAICVDKLVYRYQGQDENEQHVVFNGLDLSIAEGSFVAVLGHNGCGKSTLAKHMNAILLPQGGSVTVYGMDTRDEALLLEIRRSVGMVFQNPDNQIVSNVVEEDVAFAPHLLSGGQKQRIAIAGVIAMRPRCIVLDEPTAMLDPQGRREVLETVMRLNRESGITVVLITHHMREAALAGRVIAMSDGGILADGTPKEVFRQVELLRSAGLNVPETTQLLYELNKSGLHLPLEALSVEECAEALYHDLKDSGGTPQ